MKTQLAVFVSLLLAATPVAAAPPPFDTVAPVAFMRDLGSGAVLYAKNADRRMPPASMAKMMTVYLAFQRIKNGQLSLTQKFHVDDATWRKWNNQGSSMFLADGQDVSVADLLHGIVTFSGNDACIVLANGIGGTEGAFVDMMNREARVMHLTNTHFGTANGWPDQDRTYVSARDLATIAARTIQDFPDLYHQFYGQREFTWNNIRQPNRDPLSGTFPGADGLKTGHTDEAGYGFTGSAVQQGRRLVIVLAGMPTYQSRIDESIKFMRWGFRAWSSRRLFTTGAVVARAPVQLGSASHIDLVAPHDLAVTYPAAASGQFKASVRYLGPIRAPFAKGDHIADLIVTTPDSGEEVMPLVAAETVDQAGFFGRLWDGLKALFGAS